LQELGLYHSDIRPENFCFVELPDKPNHYELKLAITDSLCTDASELLAFSRDFFASPYRKYKEFSPQVGSAP
jgi:hypothetical protein